MSEERYDMTSKKVNPSYRKFENLQLTGTTYQVTSMLHAYFCVAIRPGWGDFYRNTRSASFCLLTDSFGKQVGDFSFVNESVEDFFYSIEDIIYPEISHDDYKASQYYQVFELVRDDIESYAPTLYQTEDGLYVEITKNTKKLKIRFCPSASKEESYAFHEFLWLATQYSRISKQKDVDTSISEFLRSNDENA